MLKHKSNAIWNPPPESPESPPISDAEADRQNAVIDQFYLDYLNHPDYPFGREKLTQEQLIKLFGGQYKEEWLYGPNGVDYIQEFLDEMGDYL